MWCSFYSARTKNRVLNLFLGSALVWLAETAAVAGQAVTLSWNPSEVTNVAGYKIYYGTNSQNYSRSVVVANTNSTTIYCLTAGTTYYFAAATVDVGGNESQLSNEASFALPVPLAQLTQATHAEGQFSFAVTGIAGRTYTVQASTDLVTWLDVETRTAPFQFVDANAGDFDQRFYRTVDITP